MHRVLVHSTLAPVTTQAPMDPATEGCFLALFDSDDYDEGDSRYLMNVPGRYPNLAELPDIDMDDEPASVELRC